MIECFGTNSKWCIQDTPGFHGSEDANANAFKRQRSGAFPASFFLDRQIIGFSRGEGWSLAAAGKGGWGRFDLGRLRELHWCKSRFGFALRKNMPCLQLHGAMMNSIERWRRMESAEARCKKSNIQIRRVCRNLRVCTDRQSIETNKTNELNKPIQVENKILVFLCLTVARFAFQRLHRQKERLTFTERSTA